MILLRWYLGVVLAAVFVLLASCGSSSGPSSSDNFTGNPDVTGGDGLATTRRVSPTEDADSISATIAAEAHQPSSYTVLDLAETSDARIVATHANNRGQATVISPGAVGEKLEFSLDDGGTMRNVDVLNDGRIVIGTDQADQVIQIWDLDDLGSPLHESALSEYLSMQNLLTLADGRVVVNGQLAQSGSGGVDTWPVQVWDPNDPAVLSEPIGNAVVREMIELSDGRIAAATNGAEVVIWDPDDASTDYRPYANHERHVLSLTELSDGRVASASDDGTVHVWNPSDPSTSDLVHDGHISSVQAVIELDDGRIVSGENVNGLVHVWDPSDHEAQPIVYSGHTSQISKLLLLADGRIASGDGAGAIHIWSAPMTG